MFNVAKQTAAVKTYVSIVQIKSEVRMTGRVAIVTGAENGVGFEVAKSLSGAGNDVIMACKDETQTKVAIDKIKENAPNALVAFMQVGCGIVAVEK